MTRRLLWPALKGGVGGPGAWELYDGASGAFSTVSLDSLCRIEAELRAAGEVEMAEAFGEQLAWLVLLADASTETVLTTSTSITDDDSVNIPRRCPMRRLRSGRVELWGEAALKVQVER